MTMNNEQWIFRQHSQINHLYAGYLPYEFHLKMARKVFVDYERLVIEYPDQTYPRPIPLQTAVLGHDLLEDTHLSYNDVKHYLGEEVAELIYAVTNEKGRNRSERANDKYYEGIRNTKGAEMVKLCDRLANVRYGKMMGGNMVYKYQQENDDFIEKLGVDVPNHFLRPMVDELEELFKG